MAKRLAKTPVENEKRYIELFTKDNKRYGLWTKEDVSLFGSFGWVEVPWSNNKGSTWIRRDEIIRIKISSE